MSVMQWESSAAVKNLSPDYLDFAGAQTLADKIKGFWHGKGHLIVATWVVSGRRDTPAAGDDSDKDKQATWCVRSNLVNGFPPK